MNDSIRDALNEIDDRYIAEAANAKKRSRKPYWFGAVAAVLALAIGLSAVLGGISIPGMTTGPALLGSVPPVSKTFPEPILPRATSIRFDSIADIQNLVEAASQHTLNHYLTTVNLVCNGTDSFATADALRFSAYIGDLRLPCRDDHVATFLCMYYYPASGALELFFDIHNIRYSFFICDTFIWTPQGETVSTVKLDNMDISLYTGIFGDDTQLLANYSANGKSVSMRIDTANPAEIDLSGFYWDNVMNIQLAPLPDGPEPEPERPLFFLNKPISPDTLQLANLVYAPHYPAMPSYPFNNDQHFGADITEEYRVWSESISQWRNQYALTRGETESLDDFIWRSTREFLSGESNQVFSPLNVYMNLAILAECTDSNSRQEILDLLGVDSIESLRIQAQKIWNAHYFSDGNNTSLLANSVWLDDSYSLNAETAQALVDNYFASVFHGDLGTEQMNQQLGEWLDSQTGGLLTAQSKHTKLEENTVFALASTLLFNARWDSKFNKKYNTIDIFHGINDDYTVEFMNDTLSDYYWGDNFGAVELYLDSPAAGSMWLILPDEGYTPQDVLQDNDWLQCVQQYSYYDENGMQINSWNKKGIAVNLSLPKFDILVQNDLVSGMKNLGLDNIFDYTVSDFSTICTDDIPIYVSQLQQAVRLTIDEDGITAAAYTISAGGAGGGTMVWDEIDFILDRPFLFVITSADSLPLFTGVVNEP